MTISLSAFAGVGTQFFDDLGNILSGGKVYTYDAGTTTPRATYTDITGLVPHSNPIILDSAGRVPSGGMIWVTDGLLYKFVVTTALDVGLDTYNNVSGISGSITGESGTRDLVMMLVSNMNKVTSGFVLPASDPALTLSIPSGSAIVAGLLVVKSSPENVVLTPSTTNHIFLQAVMDAGFNLLSANFVVNTSGTLPANSIKIGTAVTSGSAVTSTTNEPENFTIDRINGFSTSATPATNTIPVHDANGNIRLGRVVGIGTAPDTDHDPVSLSVQEIGDWGEIHCRADGAVDIMRNAKYVASNYVRRNAGTAGWIHFSPTGNIITYTALTGTAGTIISWIVKLSIPVSEGSPLTYEGNMVWDYARLKKVTYSASTTTLAAGGIFDVTLTHGLGTDDWNALIIAVNADPSNPHMWDAQIIGPDKRHQAFSGTNVNYGFDQVGAPASGNMRVRIRNSSPSASAIVNFKVILFA